MLRVAVTGGIACGKSLVGSILRERGYAVCETDELAHELMKPGEPAYEEIVKIFGEDILDSAGYIHRGRLGALVFEKPRCRSRLNGIVHPRVRDEWRSWLRERPEETEVAIVIIPLLFEVDAHSGWNAIICVSAAEETQLARLKERGLTDDQARLRIRSQMPNAEKAKRSDYVIYNDGTREALRMRTDQVMRQIIEGRNGSTK
jgi:dephospho-CoA kinase